MRRVYAPIRPQPNFLEAWEHNQAQLAAARAEQQRVHDEAVKWARAAAGDATWEAGFLRRFALVEQRLDVLAERLGAMEEGLRIVTERLSEGGRRGRRR